MKNAVPSATPQKINRKPILNVIYFVDSSKTKSFKIPLNTLRVVIAAVACVGVWAVASFFAITYFMSEQRQNDLRARQYLAAIFEYQSRYEKVFEKAYPDLKRKSTEPAIVAYEKPEAPATTTTNSSAIAKVTSAPATPILAASNAPKAGVAETAPATFSSTSLSAKNAPEVTTNKVHPPNAPSTADMAYKNDDLAGPTTIKQNVKIKETKYKYVSDKLVLSFAIYNESKTEKADGYIWGVAKFTQDDGGTTYVGAPNGISVDKDGSVAAPNASYKYSIKFYKSKNLDFAVPTSAKGQFSEIELVLMDKNGEKSSYKIPVSTKYLPSSSKPVTSVFSTSPGLGEADKPKADVPMLEKNVIEQSKQEGSRRNSDLPTPATARYEPNEP